MARTKGARLRPADVQGGTFTLSNLGNAVVNPPQAAILWPLADRVVAVDDRAEVAPTLALTLLCDHRVVDGACAAAFFGALAELMGGAAAPAGVRPPAARCGPRGWGGP